MECSGLAELTLNRPSKYNALTLDMVDALLQHLHSFTSASPPPSSPSPSPAQPAVVLLNARGKAFCAGGDIRAIIDQFSSSSSASLASASAFFRREFRLNLLLASYALPVIPVLHGLTMGGGCGLALHSPYCVLTTSSLVAMPECAIGLVPDVGSSHFLSRWPGAVGVWVALTGYRLRARDVMYVGAARVVLQDADVQRLQEELRAQDWQRLRQQGGAEAVRRRCEELLDRWDCKADYLSSPSYIERHRAWIDECFSFPSLAQCILTLRRLSSPFASPQPAAASSSSSSFSAFASPPSPLTKSVWALEQLLLIQRQSPTSLQLAFEALQRARQQSLSVRECLSMEYRLVLRLCLMRGQGDLVHGVRAAVVEKSRGSRPQWTRQRTEAELDWFFTPLQSETEGKELWED